MRSCTSFAQVLTEAKTLPIRWAWRARVPRGMCLCSGASTISLMSATSAGVSWLGLVLGHEERSSNPQAAVDWWMSDLIHREAILNAQVTKVGIGYAAYSKSPLGGYFTVDFGAP